jgi:hypothetical protein
MGLILRFGRLKKEKEVIFFSSPPFSFEHKDYFRYCQRRENLELEPGRGEKEYTRG